MVYPVFQFVKEKMSNFVIKVLAMAHVPAGRVAG
jgi:hypothetical protein